MAEDTTSSQTSLYTRPVDTDKAIIEFAAPQAAVLERDGRVKLIIVRHGRVDHRVLFK